MNYQTLKRIAVCTIFFLAAFSGKSQLVITNTVNCSVVVSIEMRGFNGCTPCGNQNVTVPANSTATVALCPGYFDM